MAEPKATCQSSTGPRAPKESHFFFCSPFISNEVSAPTTNLSFSNSTGPHGIAYPMLKHLPPSGMDLLLHILKLSWSLHLFPFIWKSLTISCIHKMENLSILLRQSCLSASFYLVYSFFWNLTPFFTGHAGFRSGRSTLDQILYPSQSISEYNKPKRGFRIILVNYRLL